VLWISECLAWMWPALLARAALRADIRKSCHCSRDHSALASLKTLRKAKDGTVTDSVHKAKSDWSRTPDVREYDDLLRREQALLSGHADVEFSGLIAVTTNSEEELSSRSR